MDNNTIRFSRRDSAQFFRTLNKRVNEYFKENNLKKTGNWKLHLKTIVMFAIFLTPYFLILTLNQIYLCIRKLRIKLRSILILMRL